MIGAEQSTVKIKLRKSADASEPVLEGLAVKRGHKVIHSVLVTSKHPVWGGVTINKCNFRMAEDDK